MTLYPVGESDFVMVTSDTAETETAQHDVELKLDYAAVWNTRADYVPVGSPAVPR